jgi:hypothetical protein
MPIVKTDYSRQIKNSNYKNAVRVATTGSITLSGLQTIDGVSVAANERVLVKNQGTSANGVYIASASSWTRAEDFPVGEAVGGSLIPINEGATYGDKIYNCTNDAGSDIVGTDTLVFSDINTGGGGNADLVQANGTTDVLTGLTASTSNDNVVAGLPGAHGIEVGDQIGFRTVTFINYKTYARNVIEITDSGFNQIEITDVVPWASNATYDIEVDVDGGGLTAVSFTINSGDTWADVITAVNAGLGTAGLAATAFFNSVGNLWSGGVSSAAKGILIRSNTFGTGSSISVSNGTVNDFYAALSAESYIYTPNTNDNTGSDVDVALASGVAFTNSATYNVSGPIYNSTFTVVAVIGLGVATINALTPSLFTNGYTTQDVSDLSADTANHFMSGAAPIGTVTVSNANDVAYSGTPVTIASIETLNVIRKHYINNGNVGVGTNEPQYPLDIRSDAYYKGNPLLKNNHNAVSSPASSDDNTQGYSVGSTWIVAGSFYICADASTGNASWQVVGAGTVTSVNGDPGPAITLSTTEINEGSNLYYTDTRFDNQLATKTSDDMPEGATNLYFSGKDTDDLSDASATNKYVTQAQKDEFHADHTNRTSLDTLELASLAHNDVLIYDSTSSKVENKPITDYVIEKPNSYSELYQKNKVRNFTSERNSQFELSFNIEPQLTTKHAAQELLDSWNKTFANTPTVHFADENFIFVEVSSVFSIHSYDGTVIDITGISFGSYSSISKLGFNLYRIGQKLVSIKNNLLTVIGVDVIMPYDVVAMFLKNDISNNYPSSSTEFYVLTLNNDTAANPVFRSYSVNYITGTITLITTLNFSSSPLYNVSYTDVQQKNKPSKLAIQDSSLTSKRILFCANLWDGAAKELGINAVIFQCADGTISYEATSGSTISFGTSITNYAYANPGLSYGLVAGRPDSGVCNFLRFDLITLVIDPTGTTGGQGNDDHPIPFPTKSYSNGFLYINTISGSQTTFDYIDAESKTRVINLTAKNHDNSTSLLKRFFVPINNSNFLCFSSTSNRLYKFLVNEESLGLLPANIFNRAEQSVGQSIPNNSLTILDLQDEADKSVAATLDLTNNRYAVQTHGLIRVINSIKTESTSWAAASEIRAEVHVNSVFVALLNSQTFDSALTQTVHLKGEEIIRVKPNDLIDVRIYQNSGGAVTLVDDGNYNYFSIASV